MKNKQFYTITNDIIFKLSLQKNLEALHKLCTIFIKDLKDEVYNPDEIKIEKTDLSSLEFKSSILDVRFEILNKYSLDFEMQKYKPSYLLEDRMLKYHAELIVRSYPKDINYNHLLCYSLWFLDFDYYDDSEPIHTLEWDSLKNRAGSITVVEINKLKNYNKDNIWYKLFTEKDYSKLRGKDKLMDNLVDDIETLNNNDSLSYLMSERHRGIVERNALEDGYRRQGLEQGLKEGLEQGLKEGIEKGLEQGLEQGLKQGQKKKAEEVALNLKKYGMSTEEIVELTGLTKEEVESL